MAQAADGTDPVLWFMGMIAFGASLAVMFNPLRKIREISAVSQRLNTAGGNVLIGSSDSSTQLPVAISTLVYVALFTNYILWTWYGALAPNFIVFIQNALGLLLTFYYLRKWQQLSGHSAGFSSPSNLGPHGNSLVTLHPSWLAAPSRINGSMLLASLASCILGVLVLQQVITVQSLGSVAVTAAILVFTSPLSALKAVIVQKHTGQLDFSMSLVLCFQGLAWLIYGFLLGDSNIIIPNALGVVLSLVQLSLFLIYPRKKKEEPLFL